MSEASTEPSVSRTYALAVFVLVYGLMLSDYMSRQVLNSVFPILREMWKLSNAQLGSLSSIVPLMVGILVVPLSALTDRFGRVRGITAMVCIWSLATLACAFATSYGEMLAARFFVGVGEAAYSAAGVALILGLFPERVRATLVGTFSSGVPVGTVSGVALGGWIAEQYGWRWSFAVMAIFGLLVLAMLRCICSDKKLELKQAGSAGVRPKQSAPRSFRKDVMKVLSSRSILFAYLACGAQVFVEAAMIVWLPAYLNRYYGLGVGASSGLAAALVTLNAVGRLACGIVADVVSRNDPSRRWSVVAINSAGMCVAFVIAFHVPIGTFQLVAIGIGLFLASGALAPTAAIVTSLTPPSIHATTLAVLALSINLLGVSPGPFLTGVLADRFGLLGALQVIPLVSVVSILGFAIGARYYKADRARVLK